MPLTASIHVADEAGLARLAAVVAAALPPWACLALTGDLGAGKTTFVKHLAAAMGIDPAAVVSPTFGLIHVHETGCSRLVHADFYRLHGGAELRETGWEDAVRAVPDRTSIVCVEWPERIADHLPAARVDVSIAIDSETARTLSFTGRDAAYEPLIRALGRLPRG